MALRNARFQPLTAFIGDKAPLKPAAKVFRKIPISKQGFLSDVRGSTTTNPRVLNKGLTQLVHEIKYPRTVDRGSLVPVLGFRQLMPNGTAGGIPNKVLPVLNDLRKVPFKAGSMSKQALTMNRLKRQINKQRAGNKLFRPTLNPGFSGLEFAKLPRWKPATKDMPAAPSGMRGVFRDIPSKGIGAFAQHLKTPLHTLEHLKHESLSYKNSIQQKPTTTRPVDVFRLDVKAAERQSTFRADNRLDGTGSYIGPDKPMQWGLLLAVAVIGFLVLKGR